MGRLKTILREYGMTVAIIVTGVTVIYLYQAGVLRLPHPLQGKPAPALDLPLLDGGQFTLADHAGKDVVVLDFWATWCPPCREGLPVVARIAKDYADQDVAVLAVNLMEVPSLVREFLEMTALDVPVALDAESVAANHYEVSSIPQTMVIGRDGMVRHVHIGTVGLDRSLRSHIDAALAAGA